MSKIFSMLVATLFFLVSCSSAEPNSPVDAVDSQNHIESYEECVAAGNPIMRSMPPKCATKEGEIFTKGGIPRIIDPLAKGKKPAFKSPKSKKAKGKNGCEDLCGNGTCEQMVCMAIGCPCAETPVSCPDDCASRF